MGCLFVNTHAQVGINIATPVGGNVFQVHVGSATSTDYDKDLVISATGNMGIHTTNPQAKLDLRGLLRVENLYNTLKPITSPNKHLIAAHDDGTFTTLIPGNIPTVQGVIPDLSTLSTLPKSSWLSPYTTYPRNFTTINITLPKGRWVVYFTATHSLDGAQVVAPPANVSYIQWNMINSATGSTDGIQADYSTGGFYNSFASTMCVFLVDNYAGNTNNDDVTYYFRGIAVSLYDMSFIHSANLWAEFYTEL